MRSGLWRGECMELDEGLVLGARGSSGATTADLGWCGSTDVNGVGGFARTRFPPAATQTRESRCEGESGRNRRRRPQPSAEFPSRNGQPRPSVKQGLGGRTGFPRKLREGIRTQGFGGSCGNRARDTAVTTRAPGGSGWGFRAAAGLAIPSTATTPTDHAAILRTLDLPPRPPTGLSYRRSESYHR